MLLLYAKGKRNEIFLIRGIPMIYTVKIEQTFTYPNRMKYIAKTDSFVEKGGKSLGSMRQFHQPYGWIKESGTPPCEHLDVIVMTEKEYELGEEDQIRVIGVFCRNDGDHKLVGVREDRSITDYSELSEIEKEDLHRLYPREEIGEGWFGHERAEGIIKQFMERRKRKTIILVQHTESEHHVNGMIGAWGDWNLTERGKKQAFQIGKMLLYEDCRNGYEMYTSDLKRARQTADEINKTLDINMIVTEIIREVNAGKGNGQPAEWFKTNRKPRDASYDPDYRPFEDAESDRDLWNRLYPFYQEIIMNRKERILIVSHGVTLMFLKSMLLGDSFEDFAKRRFYGRAGSVSKLVIEPDGLVEVAYMNQLYGDIKK